MYNEKIKFTWCESKRLQNLKKHGLDFADAFKVFGEPLALSEDIREDYGEQRMIALGLLGSLVVFVVHVESDDEIRIISMREAEPYEADYYYRTVGYFRQG
ncbi:MAG: BrnT family toxin [Azoarcus sp.]|nr:BrnT family toxin [Azoarcus sp.]